MLYIILAIGALVSGLAHLYFIPDLIVVKNAEGEIDPAAMAKLIEVGAIGINISFMAWFFVKTKLKILIKQTEISDKYELIFFLNIYIIIYSCYSTFTEFSAYQFIVFVSMSLEAVYLLWHYLKSKKLEKQAA